MATIIVETGAIVTGANSYVSVADVITYAGDRGVTLTAGEVPALLFQAMDYIESRQYAGDRVAVLPATQPLSFPRQYLYIDGVLVDSDEIPATLIKAECQLIMDLKAGYDPNGIVEKQIKEESFAVFRTVYMDNASSSPILQKVNAYLAPLLLSGGGNSFRVDRSYG